MHINKNEMDNLLLNWDGKAHLPAPLLTRKKWDGVGLTSLDNRIQNRIMLDPANPKFLKFHE
jgi:hypothetical protein